MSQHVEGVRTDLMDERHVAGHRVSVRRIHALVENRDLDARTIADRLALDISDVYRALAYYHDNPREMAALDRRRDQRIDASRDRSAVTGPENL